MSDVTIIKQFLVQLGVKFDKKGHAELSKGLQAVTASAVAMGEIMAKTAETVGKAVIKMAQDLDQLYFTSRRVNASAENIKAFSFALSQMGGTAEGAQSALEGLASFLRRFGKPGEGLINGLGVATRDTNGYLRQTTDMLNDIAAALAKMDPRMAIPRAAMLGIDEKTFVAMTADPKHLSAEEQKYRDFASRLGLGMDAGADASNKFAEKVRDLKAEFGLLFIAVASQLLPVLQNLADWLSRVFVWFTSIRNSKFVEFLGAMAQTAGAMVNTFIAMANTVARIVGPAIRAVVNSDFKVLMDVVRGIAGIIATIIELVTGHWAAAWRTAGLSLKAFGSAVVDVFGGIVNTARGLMDGLASIFGGPAGKGIAIPGAGPAPAGSLGANDNNPEGSSAGHQPIGPNQPRSVRDNNPGNIMQGGQYRHFASSAAGFAAMRAQILRDYYVHGLRTVAALINDRRWGWANEWSKGNTHAGTMNYIASVARALGISSTTQFGADPATLQRLMSSMSRFEAGGSYFNSPLMSSGAGGAISVSPNTNIHITGVHEPVEAGRMVVNAQDRVHGNLIRTLKTVLA